MSNINYYLNIKDGILSINTYPIGGTLLTDVDDIVSQHNKSDPENLTACINTWIADECDKIKSSYEFVSQDEASNAIFGDLDFVERVIEDCLGIDLSEYPDLRDQQRDLVDHYYK